MERQGRSAFGMFRIRSFFIRACGNERYCVFPNLTVSVLLYPFSVLSQLVYHEGSSFPVYGKSRESTFGRYTRLPGSVADFARRPVWDLGLPSAGLAVRFRSNSTTISVRWTNTFCNSMNHMAPTGVRGLDLYAWVNPAHYYYSILRQV